MKGIIAFLLTIALLAAACSYDRASTKLEQSDYGGSQRATEAPVTPATLTGEMEPRQAGVVQAQAEPARLDIADRAQMPAVPLERKIIRNGELTIELDDPAAAQRQISSIAETLGGFVVTSESQQSARSDQSARLSVNMIVRVPAARFSEAVEQIRATGARVLQEKLTGQDVTEEFIDLEARIRTKKALEAQFLEIMKRAQKIADALEVQRQIADVRGEIERLEGRRRFLDNQSALSTITVHLQTPAPLLASAPSGFWRSVSQAFGDGLTGAAEIILGVIRVVVVLIPVVLLIVLPVWLLWRFALRRVVSGWFSRAGASAPTPEV